MLDYTNIDLTKKAFIFELDDVLFPKQDYLLQVYYLFANLLEYTDYEHDANDLIAYLKDCYVEDGENELFAKACKKFNIDLKHQESFTSIHVHAKLPLKLLLYKEVLALLVFLIGEGKSVFILTKGNPLIQLNKVKQMEWNGLDQFIKVYLYDEIVLKSELDPLDYLLIENNVTATEAVFFTSSDTMKGSTGVSNMNINLFLK